MDQTADYADLSKSVAGRFGRRGLQIIRIRPRGETGGGWKNYCIIVLNRERSCNNEME